MGTLAINGYAYQQARKRLLSTATHCHWCHRPITDNVKPGHPSKATADHYPPRQYAGDHLNLLPACAVCNSAGKATMHYLASLEAPRHTRQW